MNRLRHQRFVVHASAAILCAATSFAASERTLPSVATKAEIRALKVKDVDGKFHRPLDHTPGQKATVFFFVLHDCPLANTCAPEINRIVSEYGPRGIRSFLVYVEDDLSAKVARKHAREHAFTCPVLLDRGQQLASLARATVSPEVAVFSPDNALLYRGRIDDRLAAPGRQRVSPTQQDLREALEAIIAGKPVPVPVTKAVGCYLRINENERR